MNIIVLIFKYLHCLLSYSSIFYLICRIIFTELFNKVSSQESVYLFINFIALISGSETKMKTENFGLREVFYKQSGYSEIVQNHLIRPERQLTFLNYEPSVSDYLSEFSFCFPCSKWCQSFPTVKKNKK